MFLSISSSEAVRKEADYPVALKTRARKGSPEVIDSPTYSNITKKVTIRMNLDPSDILHDIERKETKKLYRSAPFTQGMHGINFALRFYPTNLEGSGAALYVDVVSCSGESLTSIPPFDITVSVCDSKQLSLTKDVRMSEENCIAYEQRCLKDGFISQGQYSTLFPRLIDHTRLRSITGHAVILQVIMEYSTLYSGDAS